MSGTNKHYHFIGIGGIGMSAIAELLLRWHYHVSGSDLIPSAITTRLIQLGARINYGHASEHTEQADIVIYSSAVQSSNPEFKAARQKGLPCIRRADFLGELLHRCPFSIGISGTHGKTTTTALVGRIFCQAQRDPIILAGGIMPDFGSNLRFGQGNVMIIEADEFDRSFLSLLPTHAIITNIDSDHLDCYRDQAEIESAFRQFGNAIPEPGALVICADDPGVQRIRNQLTAPVITYGISSPADFRASRIQLSGTRSEFELLHGNHSLGVCRLSIPGRHNVANALAAIAIADRFGIPIPDIFAALTGFTGVERRFQIISEQASLMLVDDYAHHPAEIRATLTAARQGWQRRIIAVFQPHLYSRTRDLYRDFADALAIADQVIVLEIYPAREQPIAGITGKMITDAATTAGNSHFQFAANLDHALALIKALHRKGDMLLTMGAGDIWKLHPLISQMITE